MTAGVGTAASTFGPAVRLASAVRRFARRRSAAVGAVVIVGLVLVALFAPWVAAWGGQDPYTYHSDVLTESGAPRGGFGGVSTSHWFGVEPLTGRDLFAIVVHGARTSVLVGVSATVIVTVVGVLLGASAAVLGGAYDRVLGRFIDVLFGFPSLVFMIALGAIAPDSIPRWLLLVGVLSAFGWPGIARVVRSQSLALMNSDFVRSAQAMGAGPWHVLFRHLLPHLWGTIVVFSTMAVPGIIGAEAALSFLGVGVPPPTPAWGRTISSAIAWIATDPWYLLIPASALFAITWAFNVVGDRLRDLLDPHLLEEGVR